MSNGNWQGKDAAGRFEFTPKCDACGYSCGDGYCTDDEVCGGSDGPGFFLCDRERCNAKRPADVEARRSYYTAGRAKWQAKQLAKAARS